MNLVRVVATSSRSEVAVGVVNADPAYRDVNVTSAWDELVRVAAGLAWCGPAEVRDVVDLIGRLRVRPYADLVCLVDLAELLVAHDTATLRSVLGDRLGDYLYADLGGVRPSLEPGSNKYSAEAPLDIFGRTLNNNSTQETKNLQSRACPGFGRISDARPDSGHFPDSEIAAANPAAWQILDEDRRVRRIARR